MPNGHVDAPVNGHEHADGVNGENHNGKPSLRLSFSEYKRISNLIVLHLRRAEEGESAGFWLVNGKCWFIYLIFLITAPVTVVIIFL